jgi:glutamate racemase
VTVHERPIGVFDSGLGGLTVLHAMADLLPHEDLVYVGDTARYPYGERTADELIAFSEQIAHFLVGLGVKMIVVACNSATAAALVHLREVIDVPVIGVVEPGLRAAAAVSTTGRTVVIGTRLTAASGVYERVAARLELDLAVTSLACPGFVELVEDGRVDGPEAEAAVRERLEPLLSARVDTLVLGCTHFPLLARPISEVVGRRVTLVSSADETAFEVRDLLERTGWLRTDGQAPVDPDRPGRRVFYTTGDPERFATLGAFFFGDPLEDVRELSLDHLDGQRRDDQAGCGSPPER